MGLAPSFGTRPSRVPRWWSGAGAARLSFHLLADPGVFPFGVRPAAVGNTGTGPVWTGSPFLWAPVSSVSDLRRGCPAAVHGRSTTDIPALRTRVSERRAQGTCLLCGSVENSFGVKRMSSRREGGCHRAPGAWGARKAPSPAAPCPGNQRLGKEANPLPAARVFHLYSSPRRWFMEQIESF